MPRRKSYYPDTESLWSNLEALAFQSRRRGLSVEQMAKMTAGRERAKRARQKAATDRSIANRRRAKIDTPFGERWVDRCVRSMEPGGWYADRDLQNAMGAAEDHPVQVVAIKQRAIHKRANSAWRRLTTEERRDQVREIPRFLYQLTPKGEALRELCLLLA